MLTSSLLRTVDCCCVPNGSRQERSNGNTTIVTLYRISELRSESKFPKARLWLHGLSCVRMSVDVCPYITQRCILKCDGYQWGECDCGYTAPVCTHEHWTIPIENYLAPPSSTTPMTLDLPSVYSRAVADDVGARHTEQLQRSTQIKNMVTVIGD